jgi:DHA1 family tetracycline resistance protein-like MFS transporter
MVGVSLGMFGISMAVVQGVLIRVFVPKFGERKTITLGLLINFAAFVFLGVVQNGTLALLFTPLTALGAIVTPALIGLLSQRVPDDQQGELQGIIASAKAMALIFSPLVMTQIFWRFTDNPAYHLPGAPFLLSAVLVIACLFVFLTRRRQAVATS